jgi:ribosome-associated heat shock protein Hsp15
MSDSAEKDDDAGHPVVRVDVWLDVACLFRTRSEAQKACRSGKIAVNGQPARPHRLVRAGDRLDIQHAFGRTQHVIVKSVAARHVAKAEARHLYEDVTPAPTPEEIEQQQLERIYRAQMSARAPDRRQRRELRRFKGRTGR